MQLTATQEDALIIPAIVLDAVPSVLSFPPLQYPVNLREEDVSGDDPGPHS